MIWLGKWQLDRAALKVTMQSAAQRAMVTDAVTLGEIADLKAASATFSRVELTGMYNSQQQFLWDNRTHEGRAGFEVISTITLDNGNVALVNRGWIAPGPDRQNLPDVSLPSSVLDRPVTLEGYLSLPSKGFASGSAITGGEGWPKLLQFFDYDAISLAVGKPVLASVVQAQALLADTSSPTALLSRPEWLEANWQPAASGPAKHYSYAFQWFAMALALTIIFLVVNTRKIRERVQA